MRRSRIAFLVAAFLIFSVAPSALAASSGSLTLKVYSDGYVNVTQVLAVDSRATSVQVPLLSAAVSGLVATDQNGSPLSYGFAPGGDNITVYTLGASQLNLSYDTNSLTSKNGTIWTLSYSARYNSTVVLPGLSTLSYTSGTPYSINQTGETPELRVSAGTWKISYGVPIAGVTPTTTAENPGGLFGTGTIQLEVLAVVALLVVVGGSSFVWWRRRGIGPVSKELRPDDVQVLNFIQEKGGKVLEPEIRMRFALPKTSAWRQIKRLERLGYVRVTKIGSQNQIELMKERSPGA